MTIPKRDPDLRLRAFRVAARQIREAGPIAAGARIEFGASNDPEEGFQEHATLLDPDGFRSLATAIRLVTLSKSPGNLPRVCSDLKRRLPSEQHQAVDDIRNRYDRILDKSGTLFQGPVNGKLRQFSARQVLHTWLNARLAHYVPDVQADHDALSAAGAYFPFILQAIVLKLAGCALDLDDLIASALGQPRLARITGGKPETPMML